MIKIRESLSWLNQFSPTALSPAVIQILEHVDDPRTSEADLKQFADQAYQYSSRSPNALECPEAMLHCAAAFFERDGCQEAVRWLEEAVTRNQGDVHRKAVAEWMLGTACLGISDCSRAFTVQNLTRGAFMNLAEDYMRRHEPNIRLWYLDRIQEMRVDLACLPQEAYTWLNLFEPSKLSADTNQVKDLLIQRIQKKKSYKAYEMLGDLKNLCRGCSDYQEIPEILIEGGMAAFRLGNPYAAAEYLEQAAVSYRPRSHQQAVSRWLLGACMWTLEAKRPVAKQNWDAAISIFNELILRADYENHPDRKNWYLEQVEILKQAVNQKVQENF